MTHTPTHTHTHTQHKVKQRWERLAQISPHSICGRLGLKVHSKQAWSTLVWNYFTLKSIQHYGFLQTAISHLVYVPCTVAWWLPSSQHSLVSRYIHIYIRSIMLLISTYSPRELFISISLLPEQFSSRDECGALSRWKEYPEGQRVSYSRLLSALQPHQQWWLIMSYDSLLDSCLLFLWLHVEQSQLSVTVEGDVLDMYEKEVLAAVW